jgi:hypothetical protein
MFYSSSFVYIRGWPKSAHIHGMTSSPFNQSENDDASVFGVACARVLALVVCGRRKREEKLDGCLVKASWKVRSVVERL